MRRYWAENPNRSSKEKWNDIDVIASKEIKTSRKQDYATRLRECKEDMVIATLYPKLDIEVTKQTIHLLKSPFCIHPSTGNVCVPIDMEFNPDQAPKLITLQHEMEQNGNNVEKTSLQPFIELFQQHVNKVMKNDMGTVKRERAEDGETSLDF